MFIWRIGPNLLPSKDIIAQRLGGLGTSCSLCGEEVETSIQLFFKCTIAHAIQFGCNWGLYVDSLNLTSNEDIAKLILNPPDLGPGIAQHHVAFKEKISLKMALTLELIWLLRNQVLHQGENINLVPIIRNIECKVQEFLFNHVPQTQKDLDGITRWNCPPPNTIKLNVDATISGHRSTLSVVARNEKGELLKAWAKHLDGGDPLKAETHVVLWALELALMEDFQHIIIEGDAKLCFAWNRDVLTVQL